MKTIDYSKFRFRIGDTVLWREKEVKIVAYYFSSGFNVYTNYGYTILRSDGSGHSGAGCSYDEYGNTITFEEGQYWFVEERNIKGIVPQQSNNPFDKAKVGDKVRIKKLNPEKETYQFGVNESMITLEGKIFTIQKISKCIPNYNKDFPANYEISLNNSDWAWSDKMLELIEEKEVKNTFSPLIKTIKSTFKKEDVQIKTKVQKVKPNIIFNL